MEASRARPRGPVSPYVSCRGSACCRRAAMRTKERPPRKARTALMRNRNGLADYGRCGSARGSSADFSPSSQSSAGLRTRCLCCTAGRGRRGRGRTPAPPHPRCSSSSRAGSGKARTSRRACLGTPGCRRPKLARTQSSCCFRRRSSPSQRRRCRRPRLPKWWSGSSRPLRSARRRRTAAAAATAARGSVGAPAPRRRTDEVQ
mmetsp:Transcript_37115/g.103646  ORF Transcript_37115/g.103646 Transcript_37115/m.103646 type:complete len:203 (+) Transcript_37115:468-1076(+)